MNKIHFNKKALELLEELVKEVFFENSEIFLNYKEKEEERLKIQKMIFEKVKNEKK